MTKSDQIHATTKLSKPRFAAIGRLAVCWSCLEFVYGNFVAAIFGLKAKEGRIAMGAMNLRPKHEMLILVARLRNAKTAEQDFAAFWNTKVTKLQEVRNDMAHSVWFVEEAGGTDKLRMVKYRGGNAGENRILGKHYRVKTSEIVKAANYADAIIDEFSSLVQKHASTLLP